VIKRSLPHFLFYSYFKILLCCALFFVALNSSASPDGKLKKAIEKYEFKSYTEAIVLFKKIVEEREGHYTPLKYLANSYRKINDYQNAELYFSLVINSDSVKNEDFFYYALSLKSNGKLGEAKEQFEKFTSLEDNNLIGNIMIQSIDLIYKWDLQPTSFFTSSLANVNSPFSEYNMHLFKDKYYITSNREINYNSPESFSWTGTPYLSVFEIDTSLINVVGPRFETVKGKINTDYHDGPLSIDPSETSMIITRIDNELRGKDFVNRMKLFEGKYEKGKWKSFKPLPFNSNDYHTGHPCYVDTNTLYFASDRPGGQGGMDIYVSKRENGEWGEPQNVGPTVNTKQNEVFPFVKGNQLYFSSNGHSGYGGLDILMSTDINGWQEPINLRAPINSSRDDFGMYYITDSTGYYASNRADDGIGEDDIYRFYQSSKILYTGVTGVFEYNSLPVEGTKINMLDANDSVIAVAYTDEFGRFLFKELAYQQDYFLEIETDDNQLYEDGKLYLTNSDGEKISLIERLKGGKFKFKALPAEEVELELLAAEDADAIKDIKFAGQVFKKLPGDFTQKVMVYLVDDTGAIIDSVLSDERGNFTFTKLSLEDGRKYFAQIPTQDDELNLALINEDGRQYEISEAKDGKFYLSSPLDPSKTTRLATSKGLTSIIGLVEFMGKPMPNTKVLLYDSNNKLVATLFTNSKGEFQFNKLQIDESYLAVLPNVEDKENSAIYVINDEGDHLYLINQLREGKFAFKALPFDEYTKIQLEEASNVPDFVEMKGQIFKKLPGDYTQALKVYLVNDAGEIVDSVYTDQKGKFNFQKLDGDKSFTFRLEEEEDLTLVLLGEKDEILEQTLVNENGDFTYKKLTYLVAQFEPVKAIDPELFEAKSGLQMYGQVYQKLPGDYADNVMVYLVNEDGELVDSMLTDQRGKFNFSKLGLDTTNKYFVKIAEVDNELNLALINNKGRVYEIKEADGGQFLLSDPIDPSNRTKLATAKGITSIIGLVELNGKSLPNTRVLLYDGANNLIATLFTNDRGEFQFNKLKIDESYYASLPDVVDKKNSAIYVINSKGDHLYLINQLKEGKFVFKALPFDEYTIVQLKEEASVPKFVELKGQVYTNLPGDYNDNLKVYLVDDNGNIVDSAYTDQSGNFNFQKLKRDEKFTFMLEDANDLTLVLLGDKNQILEQTFLNEKGNFAYRKLTYQVAQFEPIEVNDPELLEAVTEFNLFGQVFKKLPGDFKAGMAVYIYNDDGKLIDTAYIDKEGRFEFNKLPVDTEFSFRLDDPKEDFQLLTLDEESNVVERLIKNEKGEFTYKKLQHYAYKISPEPGGKDYQIQKYQDDIINGIDSSIIIYYRFDSTLLNTRAMITLNEFIAKYKNEAYTIEVQSHTDNRGPMKYNEYLSKRRTDSVIAYLTQNNISRDRISGKYFGEIKPAVDCELKTCDNDDHYLNRRTVLKLIKP